MGGGWGGGGVGGAGKGEGHGYGIRKIYSFRSLTFMTGCRWMTYHLRVHTMIMHICESERSSE